MPPLSSTQVSDLRRLLEMYRLWQRKHFPLHGFDEALDQIADIGRTNQLKVTSSLSAHRRPLPGPSAPCLPQALVSPSMTALRPSKSVAAHVRPHGICAGELHRQCRSV